MRHIVFPTTCPECKQEFLSSLPATMLSRQLTSGEPLLLRSACHNVEWRASAREAEQIKQYLWAMRFGPASGN